MSSLSRYSSEWAGSNLDHRMCSNMLSVLDLLQIEDGGGKNTNELETVFILRSAIKIRGITALLDLRCQVSMRHKKIEIVLLHCILRLDSLHFFAQIFLFQYYNIRRPPQRGSAGRDQPETSVVQFKCTVRPNSCVM